MTVETSGRDDGLLERVDAAQRWKPKGNRRHDRWRYAAYGYEPEPIPSHRGTVEPPEPGAVGVCCSGGGVRSAAFNLGALQALQEEGQLRRARYLAAVSGGAYIAAAMSMVAKTWNEGKPSEDSNPELLRDHPAFEQGSPEEQYLRNRSSYLAPSAMDKLYIAYRIVLGIVFNFIFLALPLVGFTVMFSVIYELAFPHLVGVCGVHCSAVPPLSMWLPPAVLLFISAGLGAAALLFSLCSDERRSFVQVWSTRLIVISGIVAWVTMGVPALVSLLTTGGSTAPGAATSGVVGGGGLAAFIAGVSAHLREAIVSPGKAVDAIHQGTQWFAKLSSLARRVLAYTVAAVVGPALLLSTMVFGAAVVLADSSRASVNLWPLLIGAGAIAAFAFAYALVDLTSWSLHPFYKRRLCTAFALRRVRPSDLPQDSTDYARRVITQEEDGGIAVERDYDRLVPLSRTVLQEEPTAPDQGREGLAERQRKQGPTLIVCAAANISNPGATPPGRHVTSFTFSPYAIGGPLVGAVQTDRFEAAFASDQDESGKVGRGRDLSLPAAVAMSGAALSPSMGKMTRRPLTFLLALANVRLGVWVPNPRWVAARTDWKGYGRARPSYLIRELIGRNRVDSKYLYVTDGGHYENLGLVELLRRGCTKIYCFDASGAQSCEALGDAVALARSELGVQIDIDPSPVFPTGTDQVASTDTVRGSFRYENGTEGTLIYGITVMTKQASWDVQAYHGQDPAFPHNSTVDQLYTDQRFEAYRALGFSAGTHAVALMRKRHGESRANGGANGRKVPAGAV